MRCTDEMEQGDENRGHAALLSRDESDSMWLKSLGVRCNIPSLARTGAL